MFTDITDLTDAQLDALLRGEDIDAIESGEPDPDAPVWEMDDDALAALMNS